MSNLTSIPKRKNILCSDKVIKDSVSLPWSLINALLVFSGELQLRQTPSQQKTLLLFIGNVGNL